MKKCWFDKHKWEKIDEIRHEIIGGKLEEFYYIWKCEKCGKQDFVQVLRYIDENNEKWVMQLK